jgi:hypothetical protein
MLHNQLMKISFLCIIVGLFPIKPLHAEQLTIPESHTYHLTDSMIAVRPRCTECHSDDSGVALKPIGIFVHSSGFVRNHRFYASQNDKMCRACHRVSFCADCHAGKAELKPSFKHTDAPERVFPHRGNYLFQHRIDAKVDPTSCFRCHGRQNNRLCKNCHR